MNRILTLLTNAFPLWVLAGGALALVHPPWFTWFHGPFIVWGLALVMLGMGLTLSVEDFRAVLRMPRAVATGFAAQFTLMPLLGWGVAKLLALPAPFAVGLILVACCPGGTASNVVTFLARGHVALSVLMTMCSTFGAVVLTPLLTQWLAGTLVPVDGWGLFRSTVQVVLLPVLAGLGLHHLAPRLVRVVLPGAPLVSVVVIALIVASIIGQSADEIRAAALPLLTAVFLLHAGGFVLGYGFARWLGYDPVVCRTVSIEVGMQNSGLGVVLARRHFTDAATGISLAAVPCAISSVFHSVIGSVLAGVWRMRPARSRGPAAEVTATPGGGARAAVPSPDGPAPRR
jgi:BASS family bile acid:Na+ symporter